MLRQWVRQPVHCSTKAWQKSSLHTLAAGDNVILHPTTKGPEIFIERLKPGRHSNTHKGVVFHDDIICKTPRSIVYSRIPSNDAASPFRVQRATLDEYVRLTRRMVTPIYPGDAHLIVDLLDLHPDAYDGVAGSPQVPSISILEAGTGHGALTLYLSRAIHAANSAAPKRSAYEDDAAYSSVLKEWKTTRRAVIQTVDVSPKYSEHASGIVKSFRQGMYRHNVDFHVSDVSSYVEKRLATKEQRPFLTHALLDLPNTQLHVDTVARALHTDGTLIVFTPSITQILETTLKAKAEGIPIFLQKVLELGVNGGTGGREWDVRPVRSPPTDNPAVFEPSPVDETKADEGAAVESAEVCARDPDVTVNIASPTVNGTGSGGGQWNMVCRPKVGERIVGGGFLAIYKKLQM